MMGRTLTQLSRTITRFHLSLNNFMLETKKLLRSECQPQKALLRNKVSIAIAEPKSFNELDFYGLGEESPELRHQDCQRGDLQNDAVSLEIKEGSISNEAQATTWKELKFGVLGKVLITQCLKDSGRKPAWDNLPTIMTTTLTDWNRERIQCQWMIFLNRQGTRLPRRGMLMPRPDQVRAPHNFVPVQWERVMDIFYVHRRKNAGH